MFETALLASCLAGAIDPALVLAVIDQESARDPHALNVNDWHGGRRRALAPGKVAAAAADFVAAGYTVDVGLMGINSVNVARLGETLETALEPCTNLALGERILEENVAAAATSGLHHDEGLRAALSLYNTGSLERGFDNGYVEAVWSRYGEHAVARARTIGSRVELGATPNPNAAERGASSRVRLREPSRAGIKPGGRPSAARGVGDGGGE